MVSPKLSRKTEKQLHLSENAKELFRVIYQEQNKEEDTSDKEPKIKVSELISKMAFYYEKIRNSVDYTEEYLLRKDAIERILKRQVVIESVIKESESQKIAKHLLVELIRAGYLPNNKIPERKINEISEVIEKYIKLRNRIFALKTYRSFSNGSDKNIPKDKSLNEKGELSNWLFSIAASEIEDNLGRDRVKETAVSSMYNYLVGNIELPSDLPYEKDLYIQIYLGVYRNFLKFDDAMLSAILLKYFNSSWTEPKDDDIETIAQNITNLKEAIEKQLNHPLRKQLDKIINKYTVFYSILIDLVSEDPMGVYNTIRNKPQAFSDLIKKEYDKKYKKAKSKLWRAAIRSIIYIFLTKSIFVILLEIPATQWFGEEINPVTLGVNIGFPAFLLFLIVYFTRVSTNENYRRVVEGVEELTFQEKSKEESIVLRKPGRPSKVMNTVFGLFYTVTFFLSFGAVVWGLLKINFNWVSIIIFLFFLAFVSFFGIRIRKGTRELIVVDQKENIFTFVLDFFSIPIVAVGKWLSTKFSRVNVFVFILDFIIEAPFKVFVEIAEQWTRYVRERKEDIV